MIFVVSVPGSFHLLAQCPIDTGGTVTAFGTNAQLISYPGLLPDPDELFDFIGPGGCTTATFGPNPPTNCRTFRSPSIAALLLYFSNPGSNTSSNGCTFNCDGGTCRVRGGDALPVELMDFSVEGAADWDSPEAAEREPSDDEAEDADDT